MADPISGIAAGMMSHQLEGQKMQQQTGTGGRSFEQALQQTGQGAEIQAGGNVGQPPPISGAKLEQMRLDLEGRINRLPPGAPNVNTLLPEMIDSRTRMGLLRDVIGNSKGAHSAGTDLKGRFGQIENEWNQVEGIMKSNQDLSMPQLLGLQARLYQLSQHVEVLSKVVDQVTGGIKTILNTNV